MISTPVSQTDTNRLSSTKTRRKRTMKKKLLLTAVVFTLLLTSCGQPAALPTPTAEPELTLA
jgi:hypothetical protein